MIGTSTIVDRCRSFPNGKSHGVPYVSLWRFPEMGISLIYYQIIHFRVGFPLMNHAAIGPSMETPGIIETY